MNQVVYICLAENKSAVVNLGGTNDPDDEESSKTPAQPQSLLESVMSNQRIIVDMKDVTIKQHNWFFKLDWVDSLENQNIVIRSALGTGKTQWIVDTMNRFRCIVYISNWRTLSNAISSRLWFLSYEDITGEIDL